MSRFIEFEGGDVEAYLRAQEEQGPAALHHLRQRR